MIKNIFDFSNFGKAYKAKLYHNSFYLIIFLFLSIFAWASEVNGDEMGAEALEEVPSLWLLFFGRFHPLIVHLPIGFITLMVVVEVYELISKTQISTVVKKIVAICAALTSVFSILAGEFLALGGEYDFELLEKHELSGKLLGVSCIILVVFLYLVSKSTLWQKAYQIGCAVSFVLLAVVGHYGGTLTHGATYLTEYWPLKEKKVVKNITDLSQAIVFEDVMLPMFEKKCLQCHNESKIKGGLRMDSYELLMKGGENGPAVVPGKIEESELYKLITLDRTAERAMPPEGKTPLTNDEINIIKWWIENGAPQNAKVSDLKMNDDQKRILTYYLIPKSRPVSLVNTLKAEALNDEILAEARKKGIQVLPIGIEKALLQVSFYYPEKVTDKEIEFLKPMANNITWLDLSNTSITGKSFETLFEFKNITKLYLQNTKITDESLGKIEKLKNLEYLNLYGTGVTDKGMRALFNNKNLKKLFVWQTKVSDKSKDELKVKNPQLYIEGGYQVKTDSGKRM
ncbi:MAG: c-type cytochrome domain-containing protein [Bacteroidota bacterium]|nr:c-type cytochrome domain-containing protein [Bacteroidota bacterium]